MERRGGQQKEGRGRTPRWARPVTAALVVALGALSVSPAAAAPPTSTTPTTSVTPTTQPAPPPDTGPTPPTTTPPTTNPPKPMAEDRSHAVFAPDGCPTTPPLDTVRDPKIEKLGLYQLCADSVHDARSPAAALAIRFALAWIGTPYSQARRNDPNIFDCSSFVTRAYQAAGLPIAYPATPNRIDGGKGANAPTTQTMVDATWATPVTPLTAKPGDLLFFPGSEPPNGHVGMLLADGVMVHTNESGDVAHVTTFDPTEVTAWRAIDPTKVPLRADRARVELTTAAHAAHDRYVTASSTLAQVNADLTATQAARVVAARQLDAAHARRTAAAQAEDTARMHLRQAALTAYLQGGTPPPEAVLLTASSVMEGARANTYGATVGDEIDGAINNFEQAKRAAEAEARALERHVAKIDAHVRDLQLEARRLQSTLANALDDPSAPILGPSKLTPAELVAWYRSTGRHEATSVPVEALAQMYVEEGNRAGVRGDVAFAEAVLDTGGFTFPTTGSLSGTDNGLALVGGCDTCEDIPSYAAAALAVRAQVQLLRTYADAGVSEQTLGAAPIVPDLLRAHLKGTIASWRQLPGMAATAPEYGDAILRTYGEIASWVAAHPVAPKPGTPSG